ncbi:MAG: antibiotic biosynthesis monooxygenase family protein [Chloroflexota bacterium]
MPKSNFGMVGTLETAPENRDKLVDILTQAAALMEDIEDCHQYVVTKDADNERLVWVIELWTSKEAHDASLALPDVRALIGQAMPMITGTPSGASLVPVAGKGL